MQTRTPRQIRLAIELLDGALSRHGIDAESEVLVAYSGGADSVALLWLLTRLPRTRRPAIRAHHVDHGLRPDSAQAAEQAAANASSLGIGCEVTRVACTGGGGVEAAARRARYRALSQAADGAPILTAHTADDQAETVLYRLAKGAGLRGTGGIKERVRLEGATVLRPLLELRREAVHTIVGFVELPVVEDPTNAQTCFVRNRIRHEVLPALEAAIPGAAGGLARAARLATADDRYLEGRAHAARARIAVLDGVDAERLHLLSPSVAGRIVRRMVLEAGGGPPSAAQLQRILEICVRQGEIHLADGLVARSQRGILTVFQGEADA